MRKGLICILLATCAVCLTIIAYRSPASHYSLKGLKGYEELILDCNLPEVPSEVPRLKVVYRNVTPEEISGIAKMFHLKGDIREIPRMNSKSVGGLYIENKKRVFWFYESGAIGYSAGKSGPHYIPENLPSYEQAVIIAENLIQRIRRAGLVPDGLSIEFQAVGPGAISWRGDRKIVHYLSVSFKAFYEGMRIVGFNIHVGLGENGEILSFGGLWRRIKENGGISITVTPENALEMLKSGKFSSVKSQLPRKAFIKSFELAYYSKHFERMQDCLIPVYLFEIAPENAQEGATYYETVPATNEPFVPYGV